MFQRSKSDALRPASHFQECWVGRWLASTKSSPFSGPFGQYLSCGTGVLLGAEIRLAILPLGIEPMAAIVILALSVLALLQFAVSQWRLLWLTTANQPLSDTLRSAAGIDDSSIGANDFSTLLGLCDELSPTIRKGTP